MTRRGVCLPQDYKFCGVRGTRTESKKKSSSLSFAKQMQSLAVISIKGQVLYTEYTAVLCLLCVLHKGAKYHLPVLSPTFCTKAAKFVFPKQSGVEIIQKVGGLRPLCFSQCCNQVAQPHLQVHKL